MYDKHTRPPSDSEYLGDGVYGSFDGYHVWLHVERFEELYGPTWDHVALEPQVMDSVNQFAKKKWTRADEQTDEPSED